ncbi:MAG TPA: hypothetical protein VN457_05980, partial [Chlamydiales bacterium]|nr:hypothetical protein [Chlamydiales bacterium]
HKGSRELSDHILPQLPQGLTSLDVSELKCKNSSRLLMAQTKLNELRITEYDLTPTVLENFKSLQSVQRLILTNCTRAEMVPQLIHTFPQLRQVVVEVELSISFGNGFGTLCMKRQDIQQLKNQMPTNVNCVVHYMMTSMTDLHHFNDGTRDIEVLWFDGQVTEEVIQVFQTMPQLKELHFNINTIIPWMVTDTQGQQFMMSKRYSLADLQYLKQCLPHLRIYAGQHDEIALMPLPPPDNRDEGCCGSSRENSTTAPVPPAPDNRDLGCFSSCF